MHGSSICKEPSRTVSTTGQSSYKAPLARIAGGVVAGSLLVGRTKVILCLRRGYVICLLRSSLVKEYLTSVGSYCHHIFAMWCSIRLETVTFTYHTIGKGNCPDAR